jgi:hypothetical protein
MTACPKPERAKRGTAAGRAYMALVAQLPCACCGLYAVKVHHPIHGRYSQRRAPDTDTIPLCPLHHAELHSHPARWLALYGSDADLIEPTRRAVDRLRSRTIGGRP